MSIERTFYCDGPDCQHHGSDQFPGWVVVRDASSEMQFCCWDCVLKHAAKFPPPETIQMRPEDDDRG